jgi:hypothetical protein
MEIDKGSIAGVDMSFPPTSVYLRESVGRGREAISAIDLLRAHLTGGRGEFGCLGTGARVRICMGVFIIRSWTARLRYTQAQYRFVPGRGQAHTGGGLLRLIVQGILQMLLNSRSDAYR